MDLTDFEERVRWASRHMEGEPFSVATAEHGQIVVARLFAVAKHSIRILGGSLDSRVYASNDVLSSARQFLSGADAEMKILLDLDHADARRKHPFLQLAESFDGKVSVGVLAPRFADLVDLHFIVADQFSYKLKTPKHIESSIAAFGDAGGAKNLGSIFEAYANTPDIHYLAAAEMAA